MPIPKKLLKDLEKFLAKKVKSEDFDWPTPSEEDLRTLYGIFLVIIDAKFQRDCDGDRVIEFCLVNRKNERMPYFQPMPYDDWWDDEEGADERKEQILEIALDNLNTASTELQTVMKLRQLDRRRKERERLEAQALEAEAEKIYTGWKDEPGFVPWVPGGNSDKQDEARRLARKSRKE